MKKAKISELKNNLSRFLAYVRRGGTVRVYDRDVAIAELIPCSPISSAADGEATLATLEREDLVQRGTKKLPKDFLTRRLPKAKASVLQALLDERSEDR